jgi:hypothetical protein
VQLTGLLGSLAPLQQSEQGVLRFGEIAENLRQRSLRVRQRQALNVIAQLVDGLRGGALGGEWREATGSVGCHGEEAPFVAGRGQHQ